MSGTDARLLRAIVLSIRPTWCSVLSGTDVRYVATRSISLGSHMSSNLKNDLDIGSNPTVLRARNEVSGTESRYAATSAQRIADQCS
eukprot:2059378-Rhodomonas_salina.1